MDDETKAKLIKMYWEAYDQSDCVINDQRGNNDIDWHYWEGYSDALDKVLSIFGIKAESDIPPNIKADMDKRWDEAVERNKKYGIDLNQLISKDQ